MTRTETALEQRARHRSSVLARALPSRARRFPGIALGVLADASIVGLLGLSMWLIVRAGEQPPILHLTFAIVGVRALAIGRAAFRYAERLASHDAALAQLAVLRSRTFAALVPRVPGGLESHRRGEVLAAFVDDVDQLQDEALRVRQPLLVSGIVTALSLVVVALISVPAALVLLGALALGGGAAIVLSRRISGAQDREVSAARAAVVDALLERFAAGEVLTAFGAIEMQRERIAAAERRLSALQLRRARSAGLTAAVLGCAAGAASLLAILVMLPSLGDGLSAPLFAAAAVVPAAVFEVFAQVPAALAARRAVEASADRVAELTEGDLPAELVGEAGRDGAPAPAIAAASGGASDPVPGAPLLEVRGLAARYPGASRDAISGVDFALAPGDTLVVRGASGAGKSTLALALVRFLESRGEYRLRGLDARAMDPDAVREIVGLCEQRPYLFDSDLRQNLRFARDSEERGTASDDDLWQVLDRVGLADWALERGGLDARLGADGAWISGGQAQRIALARAILADFPVVVLDEPTAGVDRELADRLVLDLLGAVPDDRAVVLITHTELPEGISARLVEL
ncbi:thiol reductant ABC exporter subunit CydC [Leucobacter chromiiresistens]|uniref:ATP-binding cassette, subfamily C, CydC n=3 Tax=Leucobacter chromiiresistens TaxID=1079994 RepID=A0A1H1A5G9_9MICO|nr:thiol reductant ABC exporter subunit CydC [Leucobacter chromiiresistens]SDQ34850.1 ATP-binding cassette, subfamily C, CydC [Leucobacter chromiiresistens]